MPINPGRLRHQVILKTERRIEDGSGGYIAAEPVVFARAWAEIRPLTARERIQSMQTTADVSHEVTMRYIPGVTAAMLVEHEGRTFEIAAQPIDPEERHELLKLLCREARADSGTIVPAGPSATLVGISLTPANTTLNTGATQQFTVMGSYSDGSTVNLTAVANYVATGGSINSSGLFTAGFVEGSSFTVTAHFGGFTDSANVTVEAVLQSITLSPASFSLEQGRTQQLTVTGHWSDGSDRDHTATATYTPTGGTVDAAGLFTAGFTIGTFSVQADVGGFTDTSPIDVTVLTQYFQNFSDYALGAVVPDMGRARVSDSNIGWDHKVRVGNGRFGAKALILSGNGGDSRPYFWYAPPLSPYQETLVSVSTSTTGVDSCGAIVSCSVLADGKNYNEYGARLYHKADAPGFKGFQLWKYFGSSNSFDSREIDATDWIANTKMWIRLRRDATGVYAKYWQDGLPEPGLWQNTMSHDATVPGGRPGFYVNTVSSGAQIHSISVAIEGQTAASTGSNVAIATPTPTLSGVQWSDDWEAHTVAEDPPTGWAETYITSNVTWEVINDSGDKVLRSVRTGDNKSMLVLSAMPAGSTDQEILTKLRHTNVPDFGSGVALCIEGPPGDSGYAMFLSTTGVAFCKFVNDTFTNQGASPFEIVANVDHWLRFRRQGTENLGKIWRADEPEPAKWMRWMTDTDLSSGRAGLYNYANGTGIYGNVFMKAA